jgi:hypothetical protein
MTSMPFIWCWLLRSWNGWTRDPLWPILIGGPGVAKTETVQPWQVLARLSLYDH